MNLNQPPGSGNTALLTLVVATMDRPTEVTGLLASISLECRDSIEIVVVDQGSDDSLMALLTTLQDLPAIHYIHSERRNASHARNLGANLAATPWVCFPDDDARFLPDTFAKALPLLKESLALVGGQIVDKVRKPHLIQWLATEAAITPATIDHTFVESSFFIRRDVFLSVGGFDPAFGPGSNFPSAEGADLLRRLWRLNRDLPSRYTPEIAIYHPAKGQDESPATCCRVHQFAVGEGAFTARHYRQLPIFSIGRRLLFRAAGSFISRGYKRRRKIAYLRGFWQGVRAYNTDHS